MRILIVDDEPSIVALLARACARDGHQVTTMISSAEAIDYLANNPVDLLVTDISMPAPDGLQVIREARALQANVNTLAMTGRLAEYSVEDVQACGANDLIYKPVRIDEFRARIVFADQRRLVIEGLHARQRELEQLNAHVIKGVQEEVQHGHNGAKPVSDRVEG